MKKKLWEDKLN